MYSVRSLLSKNPVTISGAVMAWVNLAVIAEWLTWDAKTVAALNIALVSTLGVFVISTTVNTSKLDELEAKPAKRVAKKA